MQFCLRNIGDSKTAAIVIPINNCNGELLNDNMQIKSICSYRAVEYGSTSENNNEII